jgi:hypothetical protein
VDGLDGENVSAYVRDSLAERAAVENLVEPSRPGGQMAERT